MIDFNKFNSTGLLGPLNHVTVSQELQHRAPTTFLSSIRSRASGILATTPMRLERGLQQWPQALSPSLRVWILLYLEPSVVCEAH